MISILGQRLICKQLDPKVWKKFKRHRMETIRGPSPIGLNSDGVDGSKVDLLEVPICVFIARRWN
jgi:hypothetical protein